MKKSTYIKLGILGLIKKALFIYLLTQTHLFGSGTYSKIYFTDYEENATVYLANYYSYQSFKNLRISATTSKNLVNDRKSSLYKTVSDIDAVSGISGTQLHYLKQQSHLIDWNIYTDDFGMTLHQTNFIYALVGSLIGFTFLFFFILSIVGGF